MTMPGDYSEELVELVVSVLPVDPFDGTIPVEYDDHGIPCWGQPQKVARAILDALSSAGRLVPEGSEVEEQVGCRLWMVDDPEHPMDDWTGRGLAEIRVQAHAERLANNPGWLGRAAIIHRRQITTPWTPSEPAQEER